MAFRLKSTATSIARPRITPDPDRAAELQRRMTSLTYYPENGFHRDLRQQRQDMQRQEWTGRTIRIAG